MSIRSKVAAVARGIEQQVSEDPWFETQSGTDQVWRRRRPARFQSMDDLEALLVKLAGFSAVETFTASSGQLMLEGADFHTFVDRAAHGYVTERSQLRVAGSYGSPGSSVEWVLDFFGNGGKYPVPQVGSNRGRQDPVVREVALLVESAMKECSRREVRARVPLISPLSLDTASQRAHDFEVARVAGRKGALFGAVFGTIASLLIWLITGTPA